MTLREIEGLHSEVTKVSTSAESGRRNAPELDSGLWRANDNITLLL